jgi:Icc-related predicted phosphoesterase
MKLLAFVDLHSDFKQLKVLIAKAKEKQPDLLVCAGDISDFGKDIDYEGSFTIEAAARRLYDCQSIYIYSTQAGGANEMFLYDERASTQLAKFNVTATVDNFQFTVNITSGGIRLEKIVALVATGLKKS